MRVSAPIANTMANRPKRIKQSNSMDCLHLVPLLFFRTIWLILLKIRKIYAKGVAVAETAMNTTVVVMIYGIYSMISTILFNLFDLNKN